MGAVDGQLIHVSGEGVRREHGAARRGQAGPVKADYRVIDRGMSPAEAFRAVCAACIQHIGRIAGGEVRLNGHDPAAKDGDVGHTIDALTRIDDAAALDDEVVTRGTHP